MKYFDWDNDKNKWLMQNRGIPFEFIKECIESGKVIGNVTNHAPYEHQRVYLILIEDYVYEVPYIEEDKKIFLKTAYPSHEETKRFRKINNQNKN